MKIKFIFLLLTSFLFSHNLLANSPITSTDISEAYKDVEIVQLASQSKGKLTTDLMSYLEDENNPIDVKMAVINALSWKFDVKDKAKTFFDYLNKKYNYKNEQNFLNKASADLLICMAYLKAMDDHFHLDEAVRYSQKAKELNPKSYTINIICGIIEAQRVFNSDWCSIYLIANNVRMNTTLKIDMREAAIDIIFSYMDLYKDECNE